MCVYIVFCSALLLLLSYPVLFGRGYFCVGFSWDSYSTDDFNERAHSKTELCSHFVSLFCVCVSARPIYCFSFCCCSNSSLVRLWTYGERCWMHGKIHPKCIRFLIVALLFCLFCCVFFSSSRSLSLASLCGCLYAFPSSFQTELHFVYSHLQILIFIRFFDSISMHHYHYIWWPQKKHTHRNL